MWSPEENWIALKDRLETAAMTLRDMASDAEGDRLAHLNSKREGVRLAMSYMDEYDRAGAPNA